MICVVLGGRVVRWGLDRKREREREKEYIWFNSDGMERG